MTPTRHLLHGSTCTLALLLCAAAISQAAPVPVGDFASSSETPPHPWQVVHLNPKVPATRYRALQWDGRAAVQAQADASMALLARPLTVDLQAAPVL